MMAAVIIGIIGEAGSGKTTMTKHLAARLDALHIEGDTIGHIVLHDGYVKDTLVSRYGHDILEDGIISRKALGSIVFNDPDELEALNQLTHPKITDRIRKLIDKEKDNVPYIIIDAAVMIEAGIHRLCHEILYLYAGKNIRLSRLVENRHIEKERALAMIKSQKDSDYYRFFADAEFDATKDTELLVDDIETYLRSQHESKYL